VRFSCNLMWSLRSSFQIIVSVYLVFKVAVVGLLLVHVFDIVPHFWFRATIFRTYS
jgi:hypothetical protein